MRGAGFGLLGDLIFGIAGALGANFVVSSFSQFNSRNYGLSGELIAAAIGAMLLAVIVRAVTSRRSGAEV